MNVLSLNRLPPKRRAEMIALVIGGKTLPKEIADQIVERTDGVPLFIEEMTKTVIESGIVTETSGSYAVTGHVAPLSIPTTLQGSLLARLDRLAPTREVAQIASALGRQFSHEMISAVAPMRQKQVDDALAQLVGAELLFRRGSAPEAEYTFKHALVQEAAYSTLLRSQRILIHGRIVDALEGQFAEIVNRQPERLAHHCAEAGQIEKAVGYFLAASQQTSARSAMAESASHAHKGVELISRLPEGLARHQRELELQIALGLALLATRGYSAPEPGDAFTRARELCVQIGSPPHLVPVTWGLWQFRVVRGELDLAERHAEEMRQLSQKEDNRALTFLACHMSGINRVYAGDFLRARQYFEEGLQNPTIAMGAEHPKVGSLMWLARSLLCLGYLDQAQARYEEGLAEARRSNPFSLGLGLMLAMGYLALLSDLASTASLAEELLALSAEQGFLMYWAVAAIAHGWAVVADGKTEEGTAEIIVGATTIKQLFAPASIDQILLADAYCMARQPEEGLRRLADAEASTVVQAFPELPAHRLRARLHMQLGESNSAEEDLRQAIAGAQRQSAKFLELLAAIDLARLLDAQGKRAEAHNLLATIYGWFTEGLDTPVLKDAKVLLKELALSKVQDFRPETP